MECCCCCWPTDLPKSHCCGAYLTSKMKNMQHCKLMEVKEKTNKRNAIAPISLFSYFFWEPYHSNWLHKFNFFISSTRFPFHLLRFSTRILRLTSDLIVNTLKHGTRWLATFSVRSILLIPLEFDCVRATFSPGLISTVSICCSLFPCTRKFHINRSTKGGKNKTKNQCLLPSVPVTNTTLSFSRFPFLSLYPTVSFIRSSSVEEKKTELLAFWNV